MITLYAAALRSLGLSLEDAGVVHARFGRPIRPDTLKKWSSGKNPVNPGAWEDLRAYARLLDGIAPHAAGDVDAIEFLAEQVSPSKADDAGLVSPNSLMTALAKRLLAS